MTELFDYTADYTLAVRLALNADVGPAIDIEAVYYDEDFEVFLVHIREGERLYEEVLESKLVFSCFKAVKRGVTRWTNG